MSSVTLMNLLRKVYVTLAHFFFFGQFVGEEVIESKVLKSVTHQVNS